MRRSRSDGRGRDGRGTASLRTVTGSATRPSERTVSSAVPSTPLSSSRFEVGPSKPSLATHLPCTTRVALVANEQWAGAVHPSIWIGSKYWAETERLMPSGVIRVEASSDWAKDASPDTARCAAGDSAVASRGAGSVSTTTAWLPSPQPHGSDHRHHGDRRGDHLYPVRPHHSRTPCVPPSVPDSRRPRGVGQVSRAAPEVDRPRRRHSGTPRRADRDTPCPAPRATRRR